MAVEVILAKGVTEILKKLSSVVVNEITLVWDFNEELKNLQSTLNMILDVMEDAEKKQLTQASVRRWMEELKAIAYDAEDILDEYYYEVNLCIHQKSTVFNKVRNIFSSSEPSVKVIRKLAHQIKEINEKFNKIAKRKIDLGLQTIDVGSSSSQHELMMKNRVTDSLVVTDWKFVGRENDKSNIIKMLLEEEEENSTIIQGGGGGGNHVSVIPIMGMGGLGKTTMAQQVYNDEVVQKHFELKIWICVSDPFEILKLWKNIGKSIRKQSKEYDDAETMDAIAQLLQDDVKGKKFILVLDDVWNENSADWNNFKKPFVVGREGSKILVTTRNENVALTMVDKFKPYPLGILQENDCWYLFKEIAFGCAVAGAVETPKLVEIGKEMVKKCGGLPLAVIFLGSLMRSKKKEEEWKIIRDTKLWHESREGKNSEILPSLRLSYDYLPSHLKLCFSYCCLFPKDLIIDRKRLIRLWMAEGFLIETPEENTMSMEEIGNEYFHSLLSSFFFQDVEKDEINGDVKTCKMHDLARSVVGNHECLVVENALGIDNISEATRRLNLLVDLRDKEMLAKVLEALKKAKKLRTVLVSNNKWIRFDVGDALKENKRLRVLDLSESVCVKSYSSIGGLKHLRYFVVNEINIKKPRWRKGWLPKGVGRLSFLQTLSEFDVSRLRFFPKGLSIEELEGLNLLRVLDIKNLQEVTSGTSANLKEKKNLRVLSLTWKSRYCINNEEVVLEGLQPHPNLRTLKINGFKGSKLPSWIEDSSSSCLPNLVELEINNCNQFITPTTTVFPTLTSLRLDHIDNLVYLPLQGLLENNNTLLSLSITNCLGFKGFLPPNKDLDVDDDQAGGGGGEQLQQISQVEEVSSSSSSSSTSSSTSLQSLKLNHCPVLRFYPDIRSLTSLRVLEIQECKESSSLLTCLSSSSSSSSSSLEHLEYVKVLKNKTLEEEVVRVDILEFAKYLKFEEEVEREEEVVFEWRKSSTSTF